MTTPQIVVDSSKAKAPVAPGFERRAWRALAGLGVLLALVGVTDLALAFYPLNLSNPAYRFATLASAMNGLPILSLGLIVFVMTGLALESRRMTSAGAVMNAVMAVLVLGALIGILTASGAAFAGSAPAVHAGIRKGLIRAVLSAVLFGGTFAIAAVVGFRSLNRPIE